MIIDSPIITGSLIISGSVISTTGYTGSLFGTASFASTTSLAPNYVLISATSSMLQPYVLSSNTSSFVLNSQTSSMSVATASYVLQAVSASYVTGSIHNSTNPALSSSYAVTASYVQVANTIGVSMSGGGGVITIGSKGYVRVPRSGTINSWTVVGDQASGSIVVDVRRATYAAFPATSSIAGTALPTIISGSKATSSAALTGWGNTSLTAGDIVEFFVTTCSLFTFSSVSITYQ